MTEELRERIDNVLDQTVYGWRHEHKLIKDECLDQILALIKENYVKLAEDQSLPENRWPAGYYVSHPHLESSHDAVSEAQEDMVEADFRRVEL